jgi:chromosome segregation protein
MKLRSLKIHGFKSFADSTSVDFHEGITAIVGPNGCGKSNISDAIRWVLGEQRASAIRGAKMEEAIFQGSLNRRPVSRGSVTMVVSNEDQSLPVPFEEVEIGRTVYRDGGSDYKLNRSTVRLRDIHDLCRDTGLGANAYAVIENRMIDAILSDRADERRGLFEEAAGIGKYKDRRKAALRRLEQAESDLQRLEDVISEVETKVRSLARQKGKAERYGELRERRLSVEVSVVRNDLAEARARLEVLEKELSGDRQSGEGMVAELRALEANYEALRLREADVQRERTDAAAALESVREELVRWERDLAVASERRTAAERRLEQIVEERAEGDDRLERAEEEAGALKTSKDELDAELASARSDLTRSQEVAAEVKSRLDAARGQMEATQSRERDLARRGAQLEGDAESADAQALELDRRIKHLQSQMDDASTTLTDLEEQGDLFTGRVDSLTADLDRAVGASEAAEAGLKTTVQAVEEARQNHLEAGGSLERLKAEQSALEALERSQEGMDPAVKAVAAAGVEGVLGGLLDFIDPSGGGAQAVENYLGPLARGIVVEDQAALERLANWFAEEWGGGGGLILLPLDAIPETSGDSGTLLDTVRPSGVGAPWVEALLWSVDLVADGAIASGTPGRARVSSAGIVVDVMGIHRLGNPMGVSGGLQRKERLQELSRLVGEAQTALDAAETARAEAEAAQEGAEGAAAETRQAFRLAEDELRAASAEATAQVDQKSRLDSHRDDLVRQLEGTRATRTRVMERAEAAREDRNALEAEEKEIQQLRTDAADELESVQDEWSEAHREESRLEVVTARAEGESERLGARLVDVVRDLEATRARLGQLVSEEERLHGEVEQIVALQEKGAGETERLFGARDEAQSDLTHRDGVLRELTEQLREAERHLRDVRTAERAASDLRHRLELEREQVSAKLGLIQERLEGEWGRPLEQLLEEAEALDGDPEELRAELDEIVTKLERIGLVNMLAVEEHAEESQRLSFLTEQRDDLVKARNDLRAAIAEINETAIGLFEETFQLIRENFRKTFLALFEGGEADIWLSDPTEPLESVVEIHASPKGKKTQRIDLLSGGERALTALSLLFGIYLVKPSPFCVLDEVDAPLDENNIGRFIRLLQEFKEQTQFVVITHNPRTIEAADWIYGVTMEEPGVSKIVGVQLQEALEQSGSAA